MMQAVSRTQLFRKTRGLTEDFFFISKMFFLTPQQLIGISIELTCSEELLGILFVFLRCSFGFLGTLKMLSGKSSQLTLCQQELSPKLVCMLLS